MLYCGCRLIRYAMASHLYLISASSEPRSGLITALIATEATFLLIGLGVAVVLTTVIVRRYTGMF